MSPKRRRTLWPDRGRCPDAVLAYHGCDGSYDQRTVSAQPTYDLHHQTSGAKSIDRFLINFSPSNARAQLCDIASDSVAIPISYWSTLCRTPAPLGVPCALRRPLRKRFEINAMRPFLIMTCLPDCHAPLSRRDRFSLHVLELNSSTSLACWARSGSEDPAVNKLLCIYR